MRTLGLVALACTLLGMLAACATRPDSRPHTGSQTGRDRVSGPQRPNILFIMADDHGWQAVGAYGSVVNQTPNIDRIAAGGMRFDRAFVTNSLCAPSRAVILTGLFSHLNGVMTNVEKFDASQPTFPRLLGQSGYSTAMIGKWHLKNNPEGFDHYEILIDQGPYYNPAMIRDGERVQHTGYTTDIITDLAIDWLREGRDKSKPFVLMCQHKAPHRNWKPSPDHIDDYENETIPEPPTLFDDWADNASPARAQEMMVARDLNDHDLKLARQGELNDEQRAVWDAHYDPRNAAFRAEGLTGDDLTRWKYQRFAKDYLRCIASVDDGVGRLLDELDAEGLADNTIVVYTSDQGWFLGEHGWFDKRWMYEESFRTPLLVRWPGVIEPGSVSTDLVQNLDFAPTFLEAAGVAIPGRMQGESVVPILRGHTPGNWRQSLYYHYYEHPGVHNVARQDGVRTATHKLIHFYETDEWELYDLVVDPDELTNIYGNPGTERVAAELKAELQYLRAKYAVTGEADAMYDREMGLKK